MQTARTFTDTFIANTIGIDLRRSGGAVARGCALCNDLFLIAIQMRESQDLGDAAGLRKLILHYLERLADNCRIAGIAAGIIDEVRYAIVALLDETVLTVPGACREYWLASPLQLELFGEALAGEEFYRRLERLLHTEKGCDDALEVYLLCLCLGFEGKYRMGGAAPRLRLIQQVAARLQAGSAQSDAALWVHDARNPSRITRRGGAQWLVSYAPALLAIAVLGSVWVVTLIRNGVQDNRVAEALRALLGG